MPVQLQDYPDMVEKLGKGGFSADQTAALIQLVGRLFSDQNKHVDAVLDKHRDYLDKQRDYFEQIRQENQREHERTRSDFRSQIESLRTEGRKNLNELETRFDYKLDKLDGKVERNWRWTIAVLTGISISFVSALALLLTSSVG